MNTYALVVSVDFDKYRRGDIISDPAQMAKISKQYPQFVGTTVLETTDEEAPTKADEDSKKKDS